jgi:hypothetical protein
VALCVCVCVCVFVIALRTRISCRPNVWRIPFTSQQWHWGVCSREGSTFLRHFLSIEIALTEWTTWRIFQVRFDRAGGDGSSITLSVLSVRGPEFELFPWTRPSVCSSASYVAYWSYNAEQNRRKQSTRCILRLKLSLLSFCDALHAVAQAQSTLCAGHVCPSVWVPFLAPIVQQR